MMLFGRRRALDTRDRLASLADTAIIAVAGILSVSIVADAGIAVSGMLFQKVYDPVSMLGRGENQGRVLAEITVLHSMIGATLLAAAAIGILAMVAMILSRSFKKHGIASISCSCLVLLFLATPLPMQALACYLSAGWQPWADLPGAGEALAGALLEPGAGTVSLGIDPVSVAAAVLLAWYRIALWIPSMPGLRYMPRSLRPDPASTA